MTIDATTHVLDATSHSSAQVAAPAAARASHVKVGVGSHGGSSLADNTLALAAGSVALLLLLGLVAADRLARAVMRLWQRGEQERPRRAGRVRVRATEEEAAAADEEDSDE